MNRESRFQSLLFVPVLLAFFLVSCAHGGYVAKTRGARHDFAKGKFDKALEWYQKQNPPSKDRLLYLLDQGLILHTAGRYDESVTMFEKAIDLSEKMDHAQVFAQTASVVANDNLIPYKGEKFEKLLMHVFQILNYLGLNQENEALVEVRRIHTVFSDFFQKEAKDYLKNPFASYVSALVWESQGKINDAYIDFKTTYRLNPFYSLLAQPLLKGAHFLGFTDDYVRWKKLFNEDYKPLPVTEGEVIFIIEEGEAPEKKSSEQEADLQVLPVPRYMDLSYTPLTVTISIEGKEVAKSVPLFRSDEAAQQTLQDQMPAIISRGLARLAAKEGAAIAVGEKVDENLGLLLGIFLLATNRADLRSWLTLPRSFQIAQLSLPQGDYGFTLSWPGGSHQLKDIKISAGKKTFYSYRIF